MLHEYRTLKYLVVYCTYIYFLCCRRSRATRYTSDEIMPLIVLLLLLQVRGTVGNGGAPAVVHKIAELLGCVGGGTSPSSHRKMDKIVAANDDTVLS